jgi:hypothetical protein
MLTIDELMSIMRAAKGKTLFDFGRMVENEVERRAAGQGPICGENTGPVDADLVGCGRPIESLADVYRCTDCGVPFHRICAIRHFATDTPEASAEMFAEQLRRLDDADAATKEQSK